MKGLLIQMTRTFIHSFEPLSASPVATPTVDLNVIEIEDAGIREVLQTPGAALGTWSILDALLTPTGLGSPFIFNEPLGQAREVKVALSGLFGRFIARAYLERYFGLNVFAHLGSKVINLDKRKKVTVKRLCRGDLPDWIACKSDLSSLTIAEAKGCHDAGGPSAALARAWRQAGRIDVTVRGRKVTVKRIAIATRWGMATLGPADAHLAVKDPEDEGEAITQGEMDLVFVSLLRLHIANMIKPLGYTELSDALRRLTLQPYANRLQGDIHAANSLLDAAAAHDVSKVAGAGGLIGGIVTRTGPINSPNISVPDQEALARLNLRPIFAGIDRDLIRAAVNSEPQKVRTLLSENLQPDEFARSDRAGGWIVPLGRERVISYRR